MIENLPKVRRLADIAGLSIREEPLWAYMFECEILRSPISNLEGLTYYLQSATIPAKQTTIIDTQLAGHHFRYQTKDDNDGQLVIRFIEDENMTIYRHFAEWFELGLSNPKQLVTGDLSIMIKDRTDLINVVTMTFGDVVVSNVGEITLDMAQGEAVQVEITLSYDTVEISSGQQLANLQRLIRGIFE